MFLHTNTVVTPITISRVNADDTIVKETIASTMGYRKNLLPVDTVVFGLMHAGGKWGETSTARSNSTASTSFPFPRRRSTLPFLLRRRALQLQIQASKQLKMRLTEINFD